MLRAMPVLPAIRDLDPPSPPGGERAGLALLRDRLRGSRWRSPGAIAAMVVAAIAIGLGVFWLFEHQKSPAVGPSASPSSMHVQQQSQAGPAGLAIARSATWDVPSGTVHLKITYSAQRAPLRGPYLEVLPNVTGSAECPGVVWEGTSATRNLGSVTGIEAPCAWSVAPEPILARGNVSVTAAVALAPFAGDPTAALQQWLETASDATEKATTDSETTSTAYPAQRLTDVQVVAPTRTVSGKTLRISLLPVWPSGVDQLNPIFISPPSGRPSATLVAIAGGPSGVRFTDGCSGALSVSDDGLVVAAQSVADSCQVDATVGNFTDLTSNSFAITTRGS